ncbi:nucleolar-like protein [Thalictrum thalictroides]|uniref:Nucleolar-like protein n=1 Tax=Thalictrum thalictroides TaxID=46969 RepID=A0A7J6UT60_THATH|nr:nucleolar-like protein [Thalictrum thalictroides]
MALEASRVNSRGSMCVPVDCIVYIQEIKPWPPSHSLRSICSVFLQWNNIDRCSGSTRAVIPSIGPGVGDGKIKFNESFKLPRTLSLEAPMKGVDVEMFKNNYLEFNLYGHQADKTDKDQLLGTVALDLMEYADLKRTVSVSAPLNFKRGLRTTTQPVLSIKIQPMNKNSAFFSSRNRTAKEASLNKDEGKLMNGVYLEESDLTSFTDVDACIHSSLTASSCFEATAGLPLEERESEEVKGIAGNGSNRGSLPQEPAKQEVKITGHKLVNESSSFSSSIDLSSDVSSPEKYRTIPKSHETRSTSIGYDGTDADLISTNSKRCLDRADLVRQVHEKIVRRRSKFKENAQQFVEDNSTNTVITKFPSSEVHFEADELFADSDFIGQKDKSSMPEVDGNGFTIKTVHVLGDGDGQQQKGQEEQREKQFSADATGRPLTSSRDTVHEGRFNNMGMLMNNNSRQANPLSNAFKGNIPCKEEIKEIDIVVDTCAGAKNFISSTEKENAQKVSRQVKKGFCDGKIQELKFKTEKLERELREAAAIEMSLYSIIAEHCSSASKLYAPARRLARLYSHACKYGAAAGKASTAKSVVSGLSLVVKACGNDVPRLTFWLSNSIVLRASINETDENMQSQILSALQTKINCSVKSNGKESSLLKQKVMSSGKKGKECDFTDNFDSWEDPKTFTTALENIEAWIFSRTIHAVWCQVFSPCMQSSPRMLSRTNKVLRRKHNRSKPSLGDQEQADFSFELWKIAFQDAYDTLCPVRAGGYDCACLPILARMIMEQCLSRLDAAMFNTLLHEAVDDTIADPESDRICDSKVLPIRVGKTSFGIGAQLKNVIGKWSRWITVLLGIINCNVDSKADEYKCVNDRKQKIEIPNYEFHLLNSLSNLLMLPKDMLFNKSFREEVCPTFSAPLIKRILNNFVPDEFCPEPIPEALFQALDSEDRKEDENIIRCIPCKDAPIAYLPPATASLASILSEIRINKSSVFQKSCTSDDELDEVDSPLSSIIFDTNSLPFGKQKENEGESLLRYQLLWEVKLLLQESMESNVSIQYKDYSASAIPWNSRVRPLQTVGLSILSIAHKAYTKVESSQGIIGYIAQKVAKLSSPIVSSLEWQCIALLSYTDDQILAIENLVETIFPSTAFLFDTIDTLVNTAATLLVKIENAVDQFPNAMYQQMLQLLIMVLDIKRKDFIADFECINRAEDTLIVSTGELRFHDRPSHTEIEIEPVKLNSTIEASPVDVDVMAKLKHAKKNDQENQILDLFAEGWYMR